MSDIDREEFPNATSESGGSLFSPENASPPLPLGGDLVSDPPLSSKGNGDRETNGRFRAGNRAARGNPLARRAQQLRSALYRAVSTDDLTAVIHRLVADAKGGDTAATKLLLERLLGPSTSVDILHRIARLSIQLQGDATPATLAALTGGEPATIEPRLPLSLPTRPHDTD